MKFYRVHFTYEYGTSGGYTFFTSKRAAEKYRRECDVREENGGEIDEINITPTRKGILDALNRYADHPDNG